MLPVLARPGLSLVTVPQDTYVLHDNSFRFLAHMSKSDQYKEHAPLVSPPPPPWSSLPPHPLTPPSLQYLAFTRGMLSGALTNLGIRCQVSAEVTDTMPACESAPPPPPPALCAQLHSHTLTSTSGVFQVKVTL